MGVAITEHYLRFYFVSTPAVLFLYVEAQSQRLCGFKDEKKAANSGLGFIESLPGEHPPPENVPYEGDLLLLNILVGVILIWILFPVEAA